MSSAVCVFIAPLLGSTSFAAESPNGNAASEIRAVLKMQQEAWNRGDIDAFMNGYARGSRQSGPPIGRTRPVASSDSIVFVSEDKVTRGWQTDYEFDPRC